MASGYKIFEPSTASGTKIQAKIEWYSVGNVNTNGSVVTTKLYGRRADNLSGSTNAKDFSGSVKVGDNSAHTFSTLSSKISLSTNWLLLQTYTDTIQHDTDGSKTITITGKLTGATGTSLAGKSSSGSFNAKLDDLHKPPSDVVYTMTETNQKLIDLGIADNIFVKDLSIKSFDISGTLYDNATIKEYAIFNRLNAYSSTTLPVIVNLTQTELQTDTTYVTKIPIKAQIIDSFDTAGYSSDDLYDYIQYNKITLIETSTTTKRNGQTSGKVRLNVKGIYFNGDVGSAVQSGEYKPIIKYKFWKLNDEEPTTFDYQIPIENITISDGTYSVSNYEIGTTDETQPNYFNPDYAYRVKIYVEDNFTTYESQEKSIPVGEATWTEYKDRVDFKKITIKGNEVVLNNYSTEEQRVGTWINGKPLYRKVIILENGTNTTNTVTYALSNYNIKDVEEIFVVHPSYYSAGTYTYPFSYYDGNKFMIQVSPTDFKITVSYSNIAKNKMLITLEYTKTTD